MPARRKRYRKGTLDEMVRSGLSYYGQWGRLECTPKAEAELLGEFRVQLVVYRPGTNAVDRRASHVYGLLLGLPGKMLLVLVAAAFVSWLGAITGLIVTATLAFGLFAALWRLARRTEVGSKTVSVQITRKVEYGDVAKLAVLVGMLDSLESSTGLNAVEYELEWARIYDEIESDQHESGLNLEAPQHDSRPLYDADPNCVHETLELWSGVKCKKCPGWFCF
ncbi:DUF6611 family protein [Lysinibacter cavernae]|uniref:DUF6611 family protein n=1 Tax=Lysinibacter cavernae TaxID=1640652 RepID=UPI003609AC73